MCCASSWTMMRVCMSLTLCVCVCGGVGAVTDTLSIGELWGGLSVGKASRPLIHILIGPCSLCSTLSLSLPLTPLSSLSLSLHWSFFLFLIKSFYPPLPFLLLCIVTCVYRVFARVELRSRRAMPLISNWTRINIPCLAPLSDTLRK